MIASAKLIMTQQVERLWLSTSVCLGSQVRFSACSELDKRLPGEHSCESGECIAELELKDAYMLIHLWFTKHLWLSVPRSFPHSLEPTATH
ncbi:MAG: hypothetical protein HRT89_08920 [Lentisphaeria bacterium]|nr:hypothetical protein [Lentisphaeria bacterium]NQZ68180.1 hypothetical protein [Lentisphaeria bacterium]